MILLTSCRLSVTIEDMYIERVPNRKSPPAVLLRESYREGGKVRKRTLANLSKWPDELVRGLRVLLKGGVALKSMDDAFEILRSRPHGHVAAVLGTARKLGLERLLDRRPSRMRSLALAMIAGRVLDPRSKLAAARGLGSETQTDTLGEETGAADATADELYEAMDWLLLRRKRIERTLAAKHIEDGSLVLCDLTSVYFEGSKCPLAKRGYSRDGRRGKLQIVFALLCDREGCPVAAEVFEGNTADPGAVASQAEKLAAHFSLSRIVLVGDRGLLTDARIREDLGPAGLRWITALRAPKIRKLAAGGDLQLSVFDERDLAEISAPELYPGERLVVCRNPLLAAERARKREALLQATEAKLDLVVRATKRENRPLRGEKNIAVRADRALRAHKVGKHFMTTATDDGFSHERDEEKIAEEAALDGIYVIRTNVPAREIAPEGRGAGLQEPRPGRARVPKLQGGGPQGSPRPPPPRRPRPRPRLPLHARLLRRVAHAARPGAPALRRRRPGRRRGRPLLPRRARPALPVGARQGGRETHPRRPARPQLPDPARRSRHPDPQPCTARRPRCHDRRHPRPPHATPGQSLPSPRRPPMTRTQ